MKLLASTTARELQALQASMHVDQITFTTPERTIEISNEGDEPKAVRHIAAKTYTLSRARLMGFRAVMPVTNS